MTETPGTMQDIMNKDLAGFQLATVFYAELEHGLMGFFPAIIKEPDEPVICLDQALLAKVLEKLSKRRFKINTLIALVNLEGQFGFDIRNDQRKKTQPLHILTETEFAKLIAEKEEPFGWARGLVGNDMTPKEFRETLELALAQAAA